MCGRLTLITPWADLVDLYRFAFEGDPLGWQPGYNVSPTQNLLAIRSAAGGGRTGFMARWGLVPAWAKDESIGNRLINARSETVHEKPSFRAALKKRRCLVPVDGFYEWKREGTRKQPYYFRFRDKRNFAMAGLYESWGRPPGAMITTATLLTTTPNALMAPIHDRMPVILDPKDHDLWMDPSVGDPEALRRLYKPFLPDAMEAVPIGPAVNNPRNQGPGLIEPIA